MTVPEEVSRAVRVGAGARCQYSLMHESLQGATFHIEHIIPQWCLERSPVFGIDEDAKVLDIFCSD